METLSALLAICAGNSPVTGEFPTKRPVTRSFDVFFDLRLNKRLSKQWWGQWFEMPSRPLWRPYNVTSQVKSRQSQSYKFKKKMGKIQNLEFCKENLHITHLLDTMCKYEMKWVRLVLYCGNYRAEMILSTDGQTDGYDETSIPSSNFVEQGIYLYTSVPSQMLMTKA